MKRFCGVSFLMGDVCCEEFTAATMPRFREVFPGQIDALRAWMAHPDTEAGASFNGGRWLVFVESDGRDES